jgi:hypothetical protein
LTAATTSFLLAWPSACPMNPLPQNSAAAPIKANAATTMRGRRDKFPNTFTSTAFAIVHHPTDKILDRSTIPIRQPLNHALMRCSNASSPPLRAPYRSQLT